MKRDSGKKEQLSELLNEKGLVLIIDQNDSLCLYLDYDSHEELVRLKHNLIEDQLGITSIIPKPFATPFDINKFDWRFNLEINWKLVNCESPAGAATSTVSGTGFMVEPKWENHKITHFKIKVTSIT